MAAGVKAHGAAIMCQITHMGRRTRWDSGNWLPVLGPSSVRERAHRSVPKVAEIGDLERVVEDFAAGALRCKEGGFDGIEILSHAHLLGQFLSPLVNDRDDNYGGSLENRLRLTLQVLDAVRTAVGAEFVVGMRITGDELEPGGQTADECVNVARRLECDGKVDFLNVLAGAPYDDLGLAGWVPSSSRARRSVSAPASDSVTASIGSIRARTRFAGKTPSRASDITLLEPDLVVVATGGWPVAPDCPGSDLVLSSWDVLSGNVRVSGDVLLWDLMGDHQAVVTADVLSQSSTALQVATPDSKPLLELGPTTRSVAMKLLYERGVSFLLDMDLHAVASEGNRKKVTLRNTLTGERQERVVDELVVENGCQPTTDVYDDLLAGSSNAGVIDQRQFLKGIVELPRTNPKGSFALVRLGDAVASRNLHAALFDTARLIQGLG